MSSIDKEFRNLLDMTEDYFSGGFSRPGAVGKRISDTGTLSRREQLNILHSRISECSLCRLHATRTHTVPGEGAFEPLVFLIGEGPGRDEDRTGHPFVGRAGQYLDKWLAAIDLNRAEDCFIGNIVKCRPPENRDPLPDESEACLPYLKQQISLIQPKIILTLGRIAGRIITGEERGISSLRGKVYSFMGIPVVPTYHPSAVLRNPQFRSPVWEDLKQVKKIIESDVL